MATLFGVLFGVQHGDSPSSDVLQVVRDLQAACMAGWASETRVSGGFRNMASDLCKLRRQVAGVGAGQECKHFALSSVQHLGPHLHAAVACGQVYGREARYQTEGATKQALHL